jgi:hypothetical protein
MSFFDVYVLPTADNTLLPIFMLYAFRSFLYDIIRSLSTHCVPCTSRAFHYTPWPCKFLKHQTNMQISPLNTCDTLPHPRVASVEPPWLGNNSFSKMYVDFEQCYRAQCKTEVLILCSWQWRFPVSCLYNTYITPLYTYISVHTYMRPHW